MHHEEKPLSGANTRRQSREHESIQSRLTNCNYLTCEADQDWLWQQCTPQTTQSLNFQFVVGVIYNAYKTYWIFISCP